MLSIIVNIFRIAFIIISSGALWSGLRLMWSSRLSSDCRNHKINFACDLTKSLQRMGPSFVKLGQFLSTRPDLVGEDVADALSLLHNKLPAFSKKQFLNIIEREFGKPANQLYKEINDVPVAASIAQVHQAVTWEGEVVAVKVLRPNIEELFHRDLQLCSWIAKIISFVSPSSQRLQLDKVVETLTAGVKIELDLRMEAAAADQMASNLADDITVHIPRVYWNLTSQRVLTIEWIDGVPIRNKQKLVEAGISLQNVTHNLALSFFNQAFRDGFFHADMHPGNLLIMADGRIALVDFGIMGCLDRKNKIFVAQMLHSFIKRDYKKVADLHFAIGYIPASQSREQFTLACRSIGEPIIGLRTNQISMGLLMKQLFAISKNFQMELQPELILLQKTMVTIEGLGASLYPEVNMWQMAEPWVTQWAKENFGVRARLHNSYHNSIQLVGQVNDLLNSIIQAKQPVSSVDNAAWSKYLYIILGATLMAAAHFIING